MTLEDLLLEVNQTGRTFIINGDLLLEERPARNSDGVEQVIVFAGVSEQSIRGYFGMPIHDSSLDTPRFSAPAEPVVEVTIEPAAGGNKKSEGSK